MVLGLVVAAILGSVAIWLGVDWLEPAAERIAVAYGLPSLVQGAILIAVASSFPELASVVLAAVRHGEFELGVAAIVGSAIFNVLVIPAASVLLAGEAMVTDRELIYKDAQFYLLSVVVIFLTFALAVVYFPTGGDLTVGRVTWWLALVPLVLYGIYLGIHYLEVRDGAPPAPDAHRSAARAVVGFVAGMVAILVGVEGLLHASIGLGELFDTPSYLWGLTVVAVGTSLPDLLLSVKAARAGHHDVSLSNVFGSNTFDLLVAVPAGALVAGSVLVRLDRAIPMFAFLTVATIGVMAALRTAFVVTRREAVAFLLGYLVFVAWMLLESVAVVDLLR
ncbi:MAG: sodium:calcium antiporter [Halobacteriales archaeon]